MATQADIKDDIEAGFNSNLTETVQATAITAAATFLAQAIADAVASAADNMVIDLSGVTVTTSSGTYSLSGTATASTSI